MYPAASYALPCSPSFPCSCGLHDLKRAILQELGHGKIVRMIFIGHTNCGNSPGILKRWINADAVGGHRQRCAMPCGHHGARKRFQSLLVLEPPVRQLSSARERPADGLGSHACIDTPATVKSALRVSIVKIMKNSSHLHALVFVQFMLELRVNLRPLIEHQVLADQAA